MTKRELFEENKNNPDLIKLLDHIKSTLRLDKPRSAWYIVLIDGDDNPKRINPDQWRSRHKSEISKYRGYLEILAKIGVAERVRNTSSSDPLYKLDPSAHVSKSLFNQFKEYIAQREEERKIAPTRYNQRWLIIVGIIGIIIGAIVSFLIAWLFM